MEKKKEKIHHQDTHYWSYIYIYIYDCMGMHSTLHNERKLQVPTGFHCEKVTHKT